MTLSALDTETHLIAPGILAPPLVVGSYADDTGREGLLSPDECVEYFRELCRGDAVIAGANIPYDVAVLLAHEERRGGYPQELLTLVFDKWERDGEVHDVLVCEALHAIAQGHLFRMPNGQPLRSPSTGAEAYRYSLDIVSDLVLGRKTAKVNDFWRKRYAILERVPREEWPPDALQYPVDDAVNTRDVALAQRGGPDVSTEHTWARVDDPPGARFCTLCKAVDLGRFEDVGTIPGCKPRIVTRPAHRNIEGLGRECRADLALHLGAVWGLRTDRAWLGRLKERVEKEHAEYVKSFADWRKRDHLRSCLKAMSAAGVAPEAVNDRTYCAKSCDWGKEDGPLVTRLVAQAYGATGVCPSCLGKGRRVGAKGNEVGCVDRYCADGLPTCDTTGLDLSTAPGMPRTKGGGVGCDRDSLQESGDERLMSYGDDEFSKVRATYIPWLEKGQDRPLTLQPNVLLETLRVSYGGPPQQMPREGEARPSVIARPGWVFSSCDYSGIEMATLAQNCIWLVGFSKLAQVLNDGADPHADFGSKLLAVSYDEMKARLKAGDKVAKDFRQGAKKANFGFGGRMGPARFTLQSRKKNEGKTYSTEGPNVDEGGRFYWGTRFCILLGGAVKCSTEQIQEWKGHATPPVCKACVIQADILRRNWLDYLPEMPRYFDETKRLMEAHGEVRLPFPGTTRGGIDKVTEAANGPFQELAAVLAKTALWRVKRECYVDTASPLYRTTRIPFFVHDELFAETRIDTAHLAAARIGHIMVEAGRDIVPNVRVNVEPALSRRWLKAMETELDCSGRLIPWEDGKKGQKYLAEKGWIL